jgi:hypothetical protein
MYTPLRSLNSIRASSRKPQSGIGAARKTANPLAMSNHGVLLFQSGAFDDAEEWNQRGPRWWRRNAPTNPKDLTACAGIEAIELKSPDARNCRSAALVEVLFACGVPSRA